MTFSMQWAVEPFISDYDSRLVDCAQEYHRRCEEYDRLVCTGKPRNSMDRFPANAEQSRLINRNARETFKAIVSREGFDAKEFQRVVFAYAERR